jgi:hypothetical protein
VTKEFRNITRDVFSDQDIYWSPDSKSIVFSSDRKDHIIPGEYPVDGIEQAHYDREGWDLYSINIENKTITRLTNTPGVNEHDPLIAYDVGRLFYISDANGIENIYEADLDGKNARPITNSLSRIVQISASRDGSKLAFCAVNKTGYNLYLLRDPLERKIDNLPLTGFFAQRNESKSTTDSVIARHSTEEQERNAQDTTKGYGGVGVDLSNYVYSDNPNTERSRQDMHTAAKIPVSTITNYRDSSGHYIVRDYKVIFSSDLITGTAGYAGYYGLQGSAQLLFSDELGNHQLYFATNLIIDLKNSDYLLAYYNLTDRTNYGLQGFHSARFLYTIPDPGYEQLVWFYSRFTTYGITGIASYPLDRFTRIDLNFSALVMEKDVIDNYYGAPLDLPTKRKYALNPSISYILDNTVWSYFYPKSGTRYNIAVGAAPAINPHFVGFVTPQFDIRHYISLPLGMSFAMRLSGATSFGPNPQKFYLGGLDGWINYYTSTVAYPITEPEDVSFNGEAYPLRGYAFNERVGTKYGLANLALRLPLPFFFAGAPLAIFGEVFSDAGSAWTNQVHLFQRLRNGEVMTKDLLWSNGVGFRTYFFGFYLKLDIAWRTNLVSTSHPQYLFSVGQDF